MKTKTEKLLANFFPTAFFKCNRETFYLHTAGNMNVTIRKNGKNALSGSLIAIISREDNLFFLAWVKNFYKTNLDKIGFDSPEEICFISYTPIGNQIELLPLEKLGDIDKWDLAVI